MALHSPTSPCYFRRCLVTFSLGFAILIAVGAAPALQAPINAILAREVGDPTVVAAVSFPIGFVVLALLAW